MESSSNPHLSGCFFLLKNEKENGLKQAKSKSLDFVHFMTAILGGSINKGPGSSHRRSVRNEATELSFTCFKLFQK